MSKIDEDVIHAILEKIEASSNYHFLLEQISSGFSAVVHVQEPSSLFAPEKLREFSTITQAQYDSIEPTEPIRSRIKPLYGADQIEPFYYADKPKSWLVLPKQLDPDRARTVSNQRKVVSATITMRPRFAFANIPYYLDSGANYLEPRDMDPRSLIALLNSSLIWFWFRYGYARGTQQLIIDPSAIANAPLLKLAKEIEHMLKKIANDAYNLKKARRTYLDLWRTYSAFFKSSSKKLNQIIEGTHPAGSKAAEPLLLGAELISSVDPAYKRTFEQLLLTPVLSDNSLRFQGETDGILTELGSLFFNRKELLLHVYCSILASNCPRQVSLDQILKRTDVPLREEDAIRQTDYIFKAVAIDFHNYIMVEKYVTYDFKILDSEPLDLPENLLGVEYYLADTLAKLDASVSRIYGFSSDEMKAVLGSLDHSSTYWRDVLAYLSVYDKIGLEELPSEVLKEVHYNETGTHEHEGPCEHLTRRDESRH